MVPQPNTLPCAPQRQSYSLLVRKLKTVTQLRYPFTQLFKTHCHAVRAWFSRGSGLHIGFIDHFNIQFVITLNYSAIANLHNLQITVTQAKTFPACSVFTSSWLVTALTMASPLLLNWSPLWMAAPSQQPILTSTVLLITPLHGQSIKQSFPTIPLLLHAYPLQQERVYWTAAWYFYCCHRNLFTELLPRNGSTSYNMNMNINNVFLITLFLDTVSF
jgi:hypothetical protein